jgi:hypothetical protein
MCVCVQRHAEGVVMVTFQQPEEADLCVAAVNRRWFAGRQLEASNWDGRTKYHVKETEEEMEKRLNTWHSFIESDDKEGSATAKPPVVESNDEPDKSNEAGAEQPEQLDKRDGSEESAAEERERLQKHEVVEESAVAADQSKSDDK